VGVNALKVQHLKRVAREQGLRRYELSARTESQFMELADMYDKLDANRERKERYWEQVSTESLIEWQIGGETVIPRPINHIWWRQLMRGDPLDVIYDCPHEIHALVHSPSVIMPLSELDENRKEILYYHAVRQWSAQKLAAFRGQTDRNVRKVYNATIWWVRKKLYDRLSPRYEAGLPLTLAQWEFCDYYKAVFAGGEKGEHDG
jgi:hypothetical protein